MLSKKIDGIFDEQIYKPLEKQLPSFQEFCRDTLILKITIHGYTDPRGLSSGEEHPYRQKSKYKKNYPDDTVTIGVDERGNPVTIPCGQDMWKQGWPKDADNPDGPWIKLPDEGENGNVLLSKLRSYFTFVTFDKIMQKRSPIYSQMRNNNRVVLDAEGFGVDKAGLKERNLRDDPMSRRIEIYIDILRPEELAYHKRLMGGSLAGVQKEIKPEVTTAKVETEPKEKIIPKSEEKTEKTKIKETKKEKIIKPIDKTKDLTISNKDVDKNPPVIKETVKPQETQSATSCYMIQYNNYENETDAQDALNLLKTRGLPDTQITIYIDSFGYESFRLRSSCFSTAEDASRALNSQGWVFQELKLSKRPVIVK
jgi:hypothetical protein